MLTTLHVNYCTKHSPFGLEFVRYHLVRNINMNSCVIQWSIFYVRNGWWWLPKFPVMLLICQYLPIFSIISFSSLLISSRCHHQSLYDVCPILWEESVIHLLCDCSTLKGRRLPCLGRLNFHLLWRFQPSEVRCCQAAFDNNNILTRLLPEGLVENCVGPEKA